MYHTPNLQLISWDLPTDPYDHTQLNDNWIILDQHNHTPGLGRCIPTDGICDYAITNIKLDTCAVDSRVLCDNSVTTTKIVDKNVTYQKLEDGLLFPLGGTVPWWRPSTAVLPPSNWAIPMGQVIPAGQHDFGTGKDGSVPNPALAASSITLPDMRDRFVLGAGDDTTLKSYRDTILAEPGLAGYWRLDDSQTGVKVHAPWDPDDLVRTCADQLKLHNGWWSFSPVPAVVTGAIAKSTDGAASFDGIDDYAVLPRLVKDDFTLEIWFKNSVGGIGHGPQWWTGAGLFDGDVLNPVNDFGISMDQPGHILAGVGNPDQTVTTHGTYSDGIWHYLAVTRNKTTGAVTIYIDGQFIISQILTNKASLTAPPYVRLGSNQLGKGFFKGELDEAAQYNVCLSPGAILAHWNAGKQDLAQAPSIGQLGGNNQIELCHSHQVNPHTHTNRHNHRILDDGYHSHYYINDYGQRVSQNTHFGDFWPGYIRFAAQYVPGVDRGFGCVVASPMTFEGTHCHGGFTTNTTITTSAESPGTTAALCGVTDTRPAYIGLLQIMKIRYP